MKLTKNMRVLANSEDKLLADFDNWSVTLGDGALPLIGDPSEEQIRLPAERCFEVDDSQLQRDMKQFCDIVYPNLEERFREEGYTQQRAILAPTNKIKDTINTHLMSRLPTEEVVLLSADSTVQTGDANLYPTELLNTLQPQGLPSHKLVLRPGVTLRLMRNLNPKDGLCNGTRMVFQRVLNNKVGTLGNACCNYFATICRSSTALCGTRRCSRDRGTSSSPELPSSPRTLSSLGSSGQEFSSLCAPPLQ